MTSTERTTYYAVLGLFIALLLPYTKHLLTAWGLRSAYILGLSFAISYLLTPVVRSGASALDVVDIPSSRKVHVHPTPLMGGLAIYIAFTCSIFANFLFIPQIKGILIGSTIVVVIGVIDDVVGVGARTKLAAQLVATAIVMASGVSLGLIPRAWIGSTLVNGALTIIWIIGITNAMNFFDGMDGLAPGLAAVISFFLGILAFQTHQPYLGWLAIAIFGASVGFMPYNFRFNGPATIFLGDTGSTFLGFALACLAVLGEWAHQNHIVSISAPLLIFSVLIFDMFHTTVARFYTGKISTIREWLEYTGKDHLHHRLAEVLPAPRQCVLFILLLSSCLGLTSTVLRNAQTRDAVLLMVQAVVILLLVTILENVSRWRRENDKERQSPVSTEREHTVSSVAPDEAEDDAP